MIECGRYCAGKSAQMAYDQSSSLYYKGCGSAITLDCQRSILKSLGMVPPMLYLDLFIMVEEVSKYRLQYVFWLQEALSPQKEERGGNANINIDVIGSQLRDPFVVETVGLSIAASEYSPQGKVSTILIDELSPIVLLCAISRHINEISTQGYSISIQVEADVEVVALYKDIVVYSLLGLHLLVYFVVFSREGKCSLDELEGSASSDRDLFSQLFCVLIHRGELCAGFVEVTVVKGEWLAVVRDEEAAI